MTIDNWQAHSAMHKSHLLLSLAPTSRLPSIWWQVIRNKDRWKESKRPKIGKESKENLVRQMKIVKKAKNRKRIKRKPCRRWTGWQPPADCPSDRPRVLFEIDAFLQDALAEFQTWTIYLQICHCDLCLLFITWRNHLFHLNFGIFWKYLEY